MSEKKKKRKKGRRTILQPQPSYPLGEVKGLIAEGRVWITANALRRAQEDFNWGPRDIIDALLKLQSKHFSKPEASRSIHCEVIDVYKVINLKGENVYTHFYVDDKKRLLVVNSFHMLG